MFQRFDLKNVLARAALPSKRSPHQRYILNTHESSRAENVPPYVNKKYLSSNFYNWTWTYRKDSDIIESYGPIVVKADDPPPFKFYKRKDTPKGILTKT